MKSPSQIQLLGDPHSDGTGFDEDDQAGEKRQGSEEAGQNFDRQPLVPAKENVQTGFNTRPADQCYRNKTNQHQGSAFGRFHEARDQMLSGCGGLRDGSCGCVPTSPRYFVLRLNFKSAARASSPSAETATAGRL